MPLLPPADILVQLFVVSFFLNLLWENHHSTLYKTCYDWPYEKVMRLLTMMSLKDAFWISLFYTGTVLLFQNVAILENLPQLTFFVFLALAFSFTDEKVSVRMRRWEYLPSMPTVFGVGLTPLIELATTGVAAFLVVFLYLSRSRSFLKKFLQKKIYRS